MAYNNQLRSAAQGMAPRSDEQPAAEGGSGYGYGVGYGSAQLPADQAQPYAKQPRGGKWRRLLTPKSVFMIAGVVLLLLVSIVPLWNAHVLMHSSNYMFWMGSTLPGWIVGFCLGIIVLYAITIFAFLSYSRPQVQTEQSIMAIANIFITFLGLMLVLVAVPLHLGAGSTFDNLMHHCDNSEQTHRLYEYSQVLHNIRAQPSCASLYSVEECVGYEEVAPYTGFLKDVERAFHCSGFCYRPPVSQQLSSEANATRYEPSILTRVVKGRVDRTTPLTALAAFGRSRTLIPGFSDGVQAYPPTLFSDANYQASCDGMAARDMKNLAGDVAFQTFYQGVYLVLIAIATGFLKLIGFCVNKDRGYESKLSTA